MRGLRSRKRGFTLIETVVTVGIVAAMAAVVYPQVVKQFDAADPTRIQNDFKNIQTAIETFSVNVSGALPGDLEDLANQIVITNDSSLTTAATGLPTFTAAQAALWNGPYVDFAILEGGATETSRPTGFGALLQDSFVCYNSLSNENGVSAGTSATTAADNVACPAGAGQKFLALQITGVTCLAADPVFLGINEKFDGLNETAPTTNGRVRCVVSGAGTKATDVDVVYFLAVPLG